MKAYRGVNVQIHIFLTSALGGDEWSASRPGRFTLGEKAPSTHWIGGWVDPRAGVDDMEKRKFLTLLGLELQTLSRPVAIPTALPNTQLPNIQLFTTNAHNALYLSG
jgi:hypothetical protein